MLKRTLYLRQIQSARPPEWMTSRLVHRKLTEHFRSTNRSLLHPIGLELSTSPESHREIQPKRIGRWPQVGPNRSDSSLPAATAPIAFLL